MLSYSIEEAEELLTTKLKAAKTSLSYCEEDLEFLREQITVSQGNVVWRMLCRLLMFVCRLWRWQSRGCTTGMWYKREKKRTRKRSRMIQGKKRTGRREVEAVELATWLPRRAQNAVGSRVSQESRTRGNLEEPAPVCNLLNSC